MHDPFFDGYAAFISYRRIPEDGRWAKWLEDQLESFRIPKTLVRQGYPTKVGKVFRDESELPLASDLSSELRRALKKANLLIVICSPSTPCSKWIAQEIEFFSSLGRAERIVPILVEGEMGSSYPEPLKSLTNADGVSVEPLAADLRPGQGSRLGRRTQIAEIKRNAILKIVAAVIGCDFDELRRRDLERAKNARRKRLGIGAGLSGLVFLFLGAVGAYLKNYTERPEFSGWQFSEGIGSRGTPYCAMFSGVVNPGIVENVVIKGYKNSRKRFVLSLYDGKWNRPISAAGEVTFDFGDGEPLKLPATGDGHRLEVEIPTPILAVFMLKVADGPMDIQVPDEDVGWVTTGSGAKKAAQAVVQCMREGG